MSKHELESETPRRWFEPLNTSQARTLGSFLGLSIIVLSQAAPKIESMANEFEIYLKESAISSDINDYRFKTETKEGEICYSKESPTLANALQDTVFHNAYCPTEIEGKTKFIELIMPTKSLSGAPRKIEEN